MHAYAHIDYCYSLKNKATTTTTEIQFTTNFDSVSAFADITLLVLVSLPCPALPCLFLARHTSTIRLMWRYVLHVVLLLLLGSGGDSDRGAHAQYSTVSVVEVLKN